jgi:hypothetical protein
MVADTRYTEAGPIDSSPWLWALGYATIFQSRTLELRFWETSKMYIAAPATR